MEVNSCNPPQILSRSAGSAQRLDSPNVFFAERFYVYRSGTVNSNTVNSKFHLIRSFFQIFARFLSFSCLKWTVNSNMLNSKFHQFEVNLTVI